MRRAAILTTPLALAACTGEALTNVMPGEAVTVNGNAFTVNDGQRGLTIQNFETGRTPPAVLMANAGLAAEQVTGCPINTIIKDGMTNTYYATVTCPS
ncbi:MAG: hypothetical protein KJP02_10820 [Octadecabacter sp.]|nr:hypothetical protein [Octadecabacter sp.]